MTAYSNEIKFSTKLFLYGYTLKLPYSKLLFWIGILQKSRIIQTTTMVPFSLT